MTYHIEHAPIEDEHECHRQAMDYTNPLVVTEIARLLSHFDPYQVYRVVSSENVVQHTFWYGKEDTQHAHSHQSA